MSDAETAVDRLRKALAEVRRETRYEQLLGDAYASLQSAHDIALDNLQIPADERSSDLDLYFLTEADVSSRLAMAEQQRIANLIAYAAVEHSRGHFVETESSMSMAAEALGLK